MMSGSSDHTTGTSRQGTSSMVLPVEKWYSTSATVALSPSRALYVEGEMHYLVAGLSMQSYFFAHITFA